MSEKSYTRERTTNEVKHDCEWLKALFEMSHDGILVEENERIIDVNQSYLRLFGFDNEEDLIGRHISNIIAVEDIDRLLEFSRKRVSGEEVPAKYEFKGRKKDETLIDVEASVTKLMTGGRVIITTILRDITERKRTQILIEAQKNSLEMIVTGESLEKILNSLTRAVEYQTNGRSVASILLLDEDGCLRNGASPSLPESYIRAIDGIKVDTEIGTCSAAAALRKTVITPDINADIKWEKYKHLPLDLGLQAAWSMPIMAPNGRLLGTFGTYFREKREPNVFELQVVEILARTASLAIKRRETEDALRRSREELEARVLKRTQELAETNANLKKEMDERLEVESERVLLLKRIVTTQEEERRRIARDMHDHFGQQLTALRLNLKTLKKNFCGDLEMSGQIDHTQAIAEKLDSDMSFLVWELRPAALDHLGLRAALANYICKWSKQFGIPADFHFGDFDEKNLNGDIETHLYRIAQEALNNIYKHAQAKQASIVLEQNESDLVMIIEDDGIGFDLEEKMNRQQGLGLIGMRERSALCGGKTEIESVLDSGTNIYVRVPIKSIT